MLILSLIVLLLQELKEFWGVHLLLEAMVKKLSYTASLALVPLMEVPGVKQVSAKRFKNTLVRSEWNQFSYFPYLYMKFTRLFFNSNTEEDRVIACLCFRTSLRTEPLI